MLWMKPNRFRAREEVNLRASRRKLDPLAWVSEVYRV